MYNKLIDKDQKLKINEVNIEIVNNGFVVKELHSTVTINTHICSNKDQLLVLIDKLFKI